MLWHQAWGPLLFPESFCKLRVPLLRSVKDKRELSWTRTALANAESGKRGVFSKKDAGSSPFCYAYGVPGLPPTWPSVRPFSQPRGNRSCILDIHHSPWRARNGDKRCGDEEAQRSNPELTPRNEGIRHLFCLPYASANTRSSRQGKVAFFCGSTLSPVGYTSPARFSTWTSFRSKKHKEKKREREVRSQGAALRQAAKTLKEKARNYVEGPGFRTEVSEGSSAETVDKKSETPAEQKDTTTSDPLVSLDDVMKSIAVLQTFQKYELHPSIHCGLLSSSRLTTPTLIQDKAIPILSKGHSALLIAECGSGKTAAYAIPLLSRLRYLDEERLAPHRNCPRLIVLVPTQELVTQTHRLMQSFCLRHEHPGGLCMGRGSLRGEGQFLFRGTDVVIATPQRLVSHVIRRELRLLRVEALVIDEADILCVPPYDKEVIAVLKLIYARHHQLFAPAPAIKETQIDSLESFLEQLALPALRWGSKDLLTEDSSEEQTPLDTPRGIDRSRVVADHPLIRSFLEKQEADKAPSNDKSHQKYTEMSLARVRNLPQVVFCSAVKTAGLTAFLKRYTLEGTVIPIVSPVAHSIIPHTEQVFVPIKDKTRFRCLLDLLDEAHRPLGSSTTLDNHPSDTFQLTGNSRVAFNCSHIESAKTIVFTNSIKICHYVARELSRLHYPVVPFHGDLPSHQRRKNFTAFVRGQAQILVATNVASRGLNLPKVNHVILFNMTRHAAEYIHRAGRLARCGTAGKISSLYCRRDAKVLREIQKLSRVGQPVQASATSSAGTQSSLKEVGKWQLDTIRHLRKLDKQARKGGKLAFRRHAAGPMKRLIMKHNRLEAKRCAEAKRLYKKGLIPKNAPFPSLPNPRIEESETGSYTRVTRGPDGTLQALPMSRKEFVPIKHRTRSITPQRIQPPSPYYGANRPSLDAKATQAVVSRVQKQVKRKQF